MYEEVSIKNFKSLKDVNIKPKLITVFIGPNSSGKSSVLQALIVLKQSSNHRELILNRPYIGLGDYGDVVFKDREPKEIMFQISGTLTLWKSFNYLRPPLIGLRELGYRVMWMFNQEGLTKISAVTCYGNFVVSGDWDKLEPRLVREIEIENIKVNYVTQNVVGIPYVYAGGPVPSGREKELEQIRNDLETLFSTIRKQLERTFMIPASRGQDQPSYDLLESPENLFISAQGPSDQASKLASTLAYRRELESEISAWSERITGVKIRALLIPKKRVTIEAQTSESTISVNIINEGYGTNQLIHLLGQLVLAPQDSLIAIDDPEIHLHPKAQAELADVLVEIAKRDHKQLLISTHSEHILFRLLTDVAKKKLSSEELAIYYFDKKEGVTTIKELKVDEKGTIEEGLLGFFEADIDELRTYIEALTRRTNDETCIHSR